MIFSLSLLDFFNKNIFLVKIDILLKKKILRCFNILIGISYYYSIIILLY